MRYIWHQINEKPELLPRQKSVVCFVLLKDNNYITVRYWKDGDKEDWCGVESGDCLDTSRIDMWCYINDVLERIF